MQKTKSKNTSREQIKKLAHELDRGDINWLLYRTTGLILSAMKSMLRPHIEIKGLRHVLSESSTLYVVNHFTRAETFLIPFIFYDRFKQKVRSLGDQKFFVGGFGNFLKSTGVLSTAEPGRNRIIIGDLISSRYPWVIYPEGLLVKNKNVIDEQGDYRLLGPLRIRRPRTGSAVLAMKAELIRQQMLAAMKKNDFKKIKDYCNRYAVKLEDVCERPIVIQPVNITYYPLRPGRNLFNRLAERLIKNLPSRIKEELEIEGNLIFGSDIAITIKPAIDLSQYLRFAKAVLLPLFFIKEEKKMNWLLGYYRFKLTRLFMKSIYTSVRVNFDHLFSVYIHNRRDEVLEREHLKAFLFRAAISLWFSNPKIFIHPSIREKIVFLFFHKRFMPLENVLAFAREIGAIKHLDGQDKIDHLFLKRDLNFHEVRVKNTFRVIHNELKPLRKTYASLKQMANASLASLKKNLDKTLFEKDRAIYHKDYKKYFDRSFSKNEKLGEPFYFSSFTKPLGIVLSHGYKSSPLEVKGLAQALHQAGYAVYGVRLKGHGTAPHNLKDIRWEDWLASYNLGTAALSSRHEKIIFAGFSTGGTLSLLSAARHKQVAGVITINAALKLVDIRSKIASTFNRWNDLLNSFKITRGKLEYIDEADPANVPPMNYCRNYVNGVAELSELMETTRGELKKITAPTLVIQAENDPIVNPKSAHIIQKKIGSDHCRVHYLPLATHHVLKDKGKEQVFEAVKTFVESIG